MSARVPPVRGLLLAGGRSSRMQRDKAALAYRGLSQLQYAWQLLGRHVAEAFVSVRPDQRKEPLRAALPQIVDEHTDLGPLAGILAAQRRYPESAWLVLACDLPFLDDSVLTTLLAARDPDGDATAFRSAHDGLPEPLCAIWEPRSAAALLECAASGRSCPRKFLINARTRLLDLPRRDALDNVNTSTEYWQAMERLTPEATAARRIEVQYFALLREQAGRARESLETAARTPAELYAELQARYGFSLPADMLRVAVNDEFGEWTQPLVAGDRIVFIPPVAGG
jgi:molybdopterin-guanine dinucleotide biosynthesis protein A